MVAMRCLALLALPALLLAAPAPALADGTYFSLGMGPGEVSDDLGDYATDTFHARFAVGHRVGHLAVEGYLAPEFTDDADRSVNVELLRVGIDARYILPVNDKIELFGRLGYLLTSAEREVSSRVDGRRGNLFGSIKGESQDVVLGLGAAYNVNQRYAVRLEYQQIDTLRQRTATGEEEVSQISVGMVIRF
jgi:opacity protein-like surface antigen